MSIHKLFAACAALSICASTAFADGHGGDKIYVRKNLCEKSRAIVTNWAKNETRYTAYAMTITSEQAAADCYDFEAGNQFYAASSHYLKYFAKRQVLENCILQSKTKKWCVVIGVVAD